MGLAILHVCDKFGVAGSSLHGVSRLFSWWFPRYSRRFEPHLVGPWSKLRGYCPRLALIIHFLRWACGEVEGDTSDVDGESMARAAK